MGVLKEAWDIVKGWLGIKSIQDQKSWDELLQARIKFLKDELEDRTIEITRLKNHNPEQKQDYEKWQLQINELYRRLDDLTLELYREKKITLEQSGKILFYEKLLDSLEKKCAELIRNEQKTA